MGETKDVKEMMKKPSSGRFAAFALGAVVAMCWFFILWGVLALAHIRDTYYNFVYDAWFWVSFVIATIVSWVIEYFAYRLRKISRSETYAAECAFLKRRIANDDHLSETYLKRSALSYAELKKIVSEGLHKTDAYYKLLFQTQEGLAIISVFMNDPPAHTDYDGKAGGNNTAGEDFVGGVGKELEGFEFDLENRR